MLKDLQKLMEDYDVDDIDVRQAVQLLQRSQFVYADDFGVRRLYDLIRTHREFFENYFAIAGSTLVSEPEERMIGIVPSETGRFTMRSDEALMLIVLRLAYQEAIDSYEVGDKGEVQVDSEKLLVL
jgi:hypothetical protein